MLVLMPVLDFDTWVAILVLVVKNSSVLDYDTKSFVI